jgi:hypothetical protein
VAGPPAGSGRRRPGSAGGSGALKVLGRDVEYILYPEEHHEMKNYGRPDRRIDRMERVLAWFDRYLAAERSGR